MRRLAPLALATFALAAALLAATAPAAPGGGLLFRGERLGQFDAIEAAPGAVTEVPDPLGSGETVLRMTVDDDDVAPLTPTDDPRAQAQSPSLIDQGDEFWLRTEFLIPQGFPARVPGWLSLVSVYGPPYGGASPWRIGLAGREMVWERNRHYDFDSPWRAPLARGRWVSVLLHERFDDHGWVEMWIDGRPITFFARGSSYNSNRLPPTRRLRMATADESNGGAPNSAKIMNYREAGMFATATVYFKGLELGTTRAAVAP